MPGRMEPDMTTNEHRREIVEMATRNEYREHRFEARKLIIAVLEELYLGCDEVPIEVGAWELREANYQEALQILRSERPL